MNLHTTVSDHFCIEVQPPPCAFIIFGASGDLTHRKLIPALFKLHDKNLLPPNFFILGCARTEMTDESYRTTLEEYLKDSHPITDKSAVYDFLKTVFYISGRYDSPIFYQAIAGKLADLNCRFDSNRHYVFYLATPPDLYAGIAAQLAGAGLLVLSEGESPWPRLVVEKPFGTNFKSALLLNRALHMAANERQIYRIDHYLGKETVQNILVFRFANAIFEPFWNRRYIDHIQITVAESLGVEHRAGYFEQAGLLRDMFQNHMLQMLSLVAMEPPIAFDDRFRDETVKVLRSIRPFQTDQIPRQFIRGQYEKGVIDRNSVPAYRNEPGVSPRSIRETYLAAQLWIDNWRWRGVPFYFRAGKRLSRKVSEIAVVFQHIPHSIFAPIRPADFPPNVLVFNVQPEEGIHLTIQAKRPGPKLCMSSLEMDFHYREVFGEDPPDSYQRLLLDAMVGDQTLFIREDAMQISWNLIDPILEAWSTTDSIPLHFYPSGTSGPEAAASIPKLTDNHWRDLT